MMKKKGFDQKNEDAITKDVTVPLYAALELAFPGQEMPPEVELPVTAGSDAGHPTCRPVFSRRS